MLKDRFFWLKNKLFRHEVVKEYDIALNNLKLSKEQIDLLNWEKRKSIVWHAYQNSKFYHAYYDSLGFHPSQLINKEDWKKVPIVEKQHIRDNTSEIMTVDKSLLRQNVTGGSTGEPLTCFHDSRFFQETLDWRMYKVWNVSPGENRGKVWRMPKERSGKVFKIKNQLIWWPTHQIDIDASNVTSESIRVFLKKLSKLNSFVLYGYTGSISEIAKYIIQNNLENKFPQGKVRLVQTFASPITTVDRELVERAFGCKRMIDLYCCNEISSIAFSSPDSENLSVNWDYRHLDIVDDLGQIVDEQDVIGDVVITDLANKGFPLIKYRLGDKTSWVDTTKILPQVRPIKGRINDIMRLPSGSFWGGGLTAIFDPYPQAVLGFQIYQKKDFSICLYVIPNKSYIHANKEIEIVIEELRKKANSEIPITCVMVDEIKSDRGKQRFIISEIK